MKNNKNNNLINLETIDLKTMNSIIKYLPNKSFTNKRAIICLVLMYITGCGIRELKNFNKLTINNLLMNGTFTIYTSDGFTRKIDISGFEMDLLNSISQLVDEYYKVLPYDKHILHSSTGKEIRNNSIYFWLNSILKSWGNKHKVSLTTSIFKDSYKIRKELLNNLKSK